MNDDDTFVLKAATRKAVSLCGGLEYAEGAAGVGRSMLSNYASPNHTCTIQARAILGIEREIGRPVITCELARMQGYELHPVAEQAPQYEGFDRLLLNATKEMGEAIEELAGKDHFPCMAVYHKAEKEAMEAAAAAQLVLDEVRRRRPGFRGALRTVNGPKVANWMTE